MNSIKLTVAVADRSLMFDSAVQEVINRAYKAFLAGQDGRFSMYLWVNLLDAQHNQRISSQRRQRVAVGCIQFQLQLRETHHGFIGSQQ